MSKEPAKRDETETLDPDKGEYHGLTPQQIKKIEDARGDKEPSPTPPPEEPRSKKNG